MTAVARRREESLTPAFLAALALHVGLCLWIAIVAKPSSILPTGSAVPITLVASAPVTDSRKAKAAPAVREAQTPAPVAAAKPPEPAPAAARPAPAKPTPPITKSAPVKPTAVTPSPVAKAQPPTPALNLDALQASLAHGARTAPARPATAKRGLAQIETDLQARVDAGHGVSQSDQAGLSDLLNRLWNKNCGAEVTDAVIVPVRFRVGLEGRVVGRINAGGREASADPILAVAARRAIDAVYKAEPFGAVFRGQIFTVNFDAVKACAGR